jgi:hypothetical protein
MVVIAGDDEGKETSLLATLNVYRTGGLAARPGSPRRIVGRDHNLLRWGYDVRVLDAEMLTYAPPGWAQRPTRRGGRQGEMRTCPGRGSSRAATAVSR